jgi:heme-degrading monooxygenase HmoA
MILEVAILNVREGREVEFEAAFRKASPIVESISGYIDLELQRCLETPNRYILLIRWESLEAHTVNFRTSPQYRDWKKLLHHFYEPFPIVEHYVRVIER